MGLLDNLLLGGNGGLLSLLGNIVGPNQANAQEATPPYVQPMTPPAMGGIVQPQQAPNAGGFVTPREEGLGRLTGALGGFLYGGSPIGGLLNAAKTLTTGEATDPQTIARAQMTSTYQALQRDFGLTEPQARMAINNPALMKEYFKVAANPNMQVAPDGSIIQSMPFGRLNIAGGVPISDRMETTNPDGSKSPAFGIKPSLKNPSGAIVQPGMPGVPRAPMGAPGAPVGRPGMPGQDPTMSVSPRQIVTEQSPQATSEQKATGEGLAKDYSDIRMRGDAATKRLSTLSRMAQLSPNAYEGAGAPGLQYARSLMTTLGMSPGQVPKGEEFTALANKLVLDANNGSLGTGVSNADVSFISAMQPNVAQTKEGRMQIIQTHEALAKRDQQVAKMAYEWKKQYGSLDGFTSAMAQWAEQNPLFANREQPATFGDRFGATVGKPGDTGIRIIGVR
jgi:hypothetical protein